MGGMGRLRPALVAPVVLGVLLAAPIAGGYHLRRPCPSRGSPLFASRSLRGSGHTGTGLHMHPPRAAITSARDADVQDGFYVSGLAAAASVQCAVEAPPTDELMGAPSISGATSVSMALFAAVAQLSASQQERAVLCQVVEKLRVSKIASASAERAALDVAVAADRRRSELQARVDELEDAMGRMHEFDASGRNMSGLLRTLQETRKQNQALEVKLRQRDQRELQLKERILSSDAENELQKEKHAHAKSRQALRIAEIRMGAAEARTVEVEKQLELVQKQLAIARNRHSTEDAAVGTLRAPPSMEDNDNDNSSSGSSGSGSSVLLGSNNNISVGSSSLPIGSSKLPIGSSKLPIGSSKLPFGSSKLPFGSSYHPLLRGPRRIVDAFAGAVGGVCAAFSGAVLSILGIFRLRQPVLAFANAEDFDA
eukprot:CAMPEP_0118856850 /NCGR_PEP_ID=MMETSP1163-20130328/4172_1 /TAXON_ID=124430 /ORGANISM="Phaeomonas parva, Strain CCMP2877" /LENGTH=424 /DNA_ID=CAMNT_0006790041 /DNA_START=261 /DNA_END=1535 /DNA_ORIENTATION=+